MRSIPPVGRVVRIATAVVAIGIAVPVAAVAVAVSDAQAATPIARVAMDPAVGRTVAVVVIIDRRLSGVVVAVAVPIGVTGGAAGNGAGGEAANKMPEHGGVACLSVLQPPPRALTPYLIAPERRCVSCTVRPSLGCAQSNP